MRHPILHIILLFVTSLPAVSQVLSAQGRFSVSFDKGCAPLTVHITELDPFGVVTRQYRYFEGATLTSSQTFTYQDPGTYLIKQFIGADDIGDKTDSLLIVVTASEEPLLEITKCSNLSVHIQSTDTFYDSVRVYFTADDSVTLLPQETTEYTFASSEMKTLRKKGFFKNATENCLSFTQTIEPILTLRAPKITELAIKESCKDVFRLTLEIEDFDPYIDYQVILSQSSDQEVFAGKLAQNFIQLDDITFTPGSYCVSIRAIDGCDASIQDTNEVCGQTNSLSLTPFATLYSTYDTSGIYIHTDTITSGSFDIYRKLEDEPYGYLTNRRGSFTDVLGSTSREYSYRLDYIDSCGQILSSAETHPPFIEAKRTALNTYRVSYTPSLNNLADNPQLSYRAGSIIRSEQEPIVGDVFIVSLDAKNGTPRQEIEVIESYSELLIRSNDQTVRHELKLFVPSAFTPNGDGLNDTLEVFGLPTDVATMHIYNRWGTRISTTTTPNLAWSGSLRGENAPEGTYLYEITFETLEGTRKTQKGTFVLLTN